MTLIARGDTTIPVTVQARTSLSPADAFEVIVPIDLSLVFTGWRRFFPGVWGAQNQTGEWDHVGASRNPELSDGSTAIEVLTEYTSPSSFAYELTEFTNVLGRVALGVRGEWTFAPDGSGALIRWTYEFKPRPGRAALVASVIAPLWRRYMLAGISSTVIVAEHLVSQRTSARRAGSGSLAGAPVLADRLRSGGQTLT